MSVRLENWSLLDHRDSPYTAPERALRSLKGTVYGHPKREDGYCVETSPIVKVDGREVTTMSGTVYVLGAIDPEYLDWMRANGYEYDEAHPIRVRTR